jgi:hypothetical protein
VSCNWVRAYIVRLLSDDFLQMYSTTLFQLLALSAWLNNKQLETMSTVEDYRHKEKK